MPAKNPFCHSLFVVSTILSKEAQSIFNGYFFSRYQESSDRFLIGKCDSVKYESVLFLSIGNSISLTFERYQPLEKIFDIYCRNKREYKRISHISASKNHREFFCHTFS